jgi:cellulose synthase (UDP-forming)
VTPKERQSGIYLNLVIPQLILFGLTIVGICWCLFRFAMGTLTDSWIYIINGAWAIYNLTLLWAVIHAAVWQPPQVGIRD